MKDYYSLLFITSCVLVFSHNLLFAQEALTDSIETVFIRSTRINENLQRSSSSVSQLSIHSIPLQQSLSINEYLTAIPGLFALNAHNYAQDLRISIRGFGARSSFGIRGVKIMVDGIPETTPDGQGQIDNLELNMLETIEVIRGPSSSLYGNASGGILDIRTKSELEENFSEIGASAGSYGMFSFYGKAGVQMSGTDLIFHLGHLRTDGYREHSGMKSTIVSAKINRKFSKRSRLRFNLNYLNSPQADDPGGIDLASVSENRRQARPLNVLFDAGERVNQFKAGVVYEFDWDPKKSLNTYAFISTRDFLGRLPFEFGGIVDLSRIYAGQGGHLNFGQMLGNGVNKVQVGYEVAYQRDHRMRFINTEGIPGSQTLDQVESFGNFGIFLLDQFQLNNLTLTGGLRYDINVLKIDDNFIGNGDQSGSRTLNAVNPSLGANYEFMDGQHLFAHYSTSFETPALSELSANPGKSGGFNSELSAQNAKSIELGFKGQTARGSTYELVYFHINTKNEIVPFEIEAFPGRDFFRNAGSTVRNGLEAMLTYRISAFLNARFMYTYSDFSYGEYLLPAGDLNGNVLAGIPTHFGSLSINYVTPSKWQFGVSTVHRGNLYTADDNAISDGSSTLINLSFSGDMKVAGFSCSPFAGINNLLDVEYNDNIRINAFGGRYYEPGPGIHFYGGMKVRF